MSGSEIYAYRGVSNPNYALQINSGNYLVSDYGNDRIIELNTAYPSPVKEYAINDPVFFDYSEENETLLVTSESLNTIYEISWSDLDFGRIIWQSTCSLDAPQCATYKQNDMTRIVIADTGNNRVIKCNRNESSYQSVSYYKLNEDDTGTVHEISSFYMPYRVYEYLNGNICVVEKEGRTLGFTAIESSSSSSSSSSIDSSSSSSSIDSSSSSQSI